MNDLEQLDINQYPVTDLSKVRNDFVSQISSFRMMHFERALRVKAIPPIKGEITKGKLKWRGIELVSHNHRQWLEQRGKRISKILGWKGSLHGGDLNAKVWFGVIEE